LGGTGFGGVAVLGRKQFFFEKKNQKTFAHEVRDSTDKSFLLLFSKKEVLA
jgi:hypothetical protein